MTQALLEKVARAIWEGENGARPDEEWQELWSFKVFNSRGTRAATNAIRAYEEAKNNQ